jgi:hypothetical protein
VAHIQRPEGPFAENNQAHNTDARRIDELPKILHPAIRRSTAAAKTSRAIGVTARRRPRIGVNQGHHAIAAGPRLRLHQHRGRALDETLDLADQLGAERAIDGAVIA